MEILDRTKPISCRTTTATGYLATHIAASPPRRCRRPGADVRGYFASSLMDNSELAYGYEKRFGIARQYAQRFARGEIDLDR